MSNDNNYVEKCFDRLQSMDIDEKSLKSDLYLCTCVLAELKYPIELIKSTMDEEIMQESAIYKCIFDEGMKKGMEESIIRILSKRFGNISPGLADIIYHAENKSQLDELIDLALSSNNLSEFKKKIQNTITLYNI